MNKKIGSTVAEFAAAQGDGLTGLEKRAGKPAPLKQRQTQAEFDKLERDGLICRTEQLRDGWPVYVTTDKNHVEDEIERLEQLERDRQ